jgi:4'-phosphopantetheinyl transferase
LGALAVSREREIGVDIEAVRPIEDDIAGQYFSPREVAALRALPESEHLAAFYRCWTRKEAIVKAIGEGLSHPLTSFDVSLGPATPAIVERFEGEPDAAGVWRLANFEPASGYAGAVACRTAGAALALRLRNVEG